MKRPVPARYIAVIFLAAAALRLIAALAFPVYPLVDNTADTEIYDAGARSLARGEGYQWQGKATAFFPIGWPLLLSFSYRAAGISATNGQWLNVILSLGLLFAAWKCAERLAGPMVAFLTLAILALAPHQVIFPAFLMSETAFTAFFMTSLWLLSRGPGSIASLIPAGIAMGMATLVRGPALVMPLFVLLWARFGERRRLAPSLFRAAIFGAALLIPIVPWAVRNHHVFGKWVMVANDGGMNFLMGNHHGATGARHEPAEGLPDTGDEVKDDREGYRRGLAFIRSRPGEFLSLLPRKFIRLTAAAPLLTYRAELLAKWPKPIAYGLLGLDQLLHAALWVLAGLALWRGVRANGGPSRAAIFALSAIGVWIAIHLVFLGGARYFFPVMPLLVILAVSGLRFDETADVSESGS